MKAQEIRALSNDQLKDKLFGLRKEQMNLRFQQATGQMETPTRVREVRKVVARLKTEMTARDRAAAGE
ncbi:MAG: 50S ribosomal protein L29 [Proteobacteria bacterium]|nr:50S ribosomal protein L29 [Pseudomonadota bacterium]